MAKDPDSVVFYNSRAEIALGTGFHPKEHYAFLYSNYGQYFAIKGNSPKALDNFRKAYSFFPELKDTVLIISSLCNLSEIFRYESRIDSGRYYAELAIAWIDSMGLSSINKVRPLGLLGMYYAIDNEYGRAIATMREAIAIAEQYEKISNLVFLYSNIGLTYNDIGYYDKSVDYYLKALSLAEKTNNRINMANLYGIIGNVYVAMGLPSKGLEYHRKSKEAFTSLGDAYNLCEAYYRLFSVFKLLAKEDSMQFYMDLTLERSRSVGNNGTLASILASIGEMHYKASNYTRALEHYTEANNVIAQGIDSLEMLKNLAMIAELYGRLGQLDARDRAIQATLRLLNRSENPSVNREAYNALFNSYYHSGEFKKAIDVQQKMIDNIDTLYLRKDRLETAGLLSEFYFDQRQKDLKSRQLQKDLEQTEILNKQRLVIYMSVSLTIIAFLVAAFQIRDRRQRSRNIKVLQDSKDEIERQSIQLEEINQVKNKLFSIIAHDLRGPLGTLSAVLDLLNNNQISTEDFQKLVVQLKENLQRTTSITNNLLVWARSQMEGDHLSLQLVDLPQLLKEVIHQTETEAMQKGIVIRLACDEEIESSTDKERITIAIRNLLANSIKYCKRGDTIDLLLYKEDGFVIIVVKDSGIGMSKDILQKLQSSIGFTTKGTANELGTGLGLKIVADFISKLGGVIDIKSEPNIGTEVRIQLPYIQV